MSNATKVRIIVDEVPHGKVIRVDHGGPGNQTNLDPGDHEFHIEEGRALTIQAVNENQG